MLCQSHSLGRLSTFESCMNARSAESKLHNKYNEHFHLLQINNKIQSESDYKVYDNVTGEFITNELNRDYQLTELSKRLMRIVEEIV